MPSLHDSKEDLIDVLWHKMQELGVDQDLIASVSLKTLHLVPAGPDVEGYNKLVDAIVECAWKLGVRDALTAVEVGAIAGVRPTSNQGNN